MKAQRFGASGGGACGCRDPLEGVTVVTFLAPELRVKTLDRFGHGDGGALRRDPLGGVFMELRYLVSWQVGTCGHARILTRSFFGPGVGRF